MKQQIVVVGLFMTLAISPARGAETVKGEFEALNQHKSNTVRVDPGVDWTAYGAIVPRPTVYEPARPGRELTAKQEEKVRAAVDTSLSAAFSGEVKEGARVLEVRPVITEVRRAHPWVNVLSFAAVQAPVSYGGVSVRYELFDAETGEQVGEVESKRCAGPWNIYPWQLLQAFQPVGHASTLLKRDSKMLRKDLSAIEGVPGDR